MGVRDAVAALGRGPTSAGTDHLTLALPPGLRLDQIADRVGALPGHDRAAFLALAQSGQVRSKYQGDQVSNEGFTWPDTYFVSPHETDLQILQTIVAEFDKHGDAVGLGCTAGGRSHPAAGRGRRVAGAGRGRERGRRTEGRGRDRESPPAGDAAADRRHPLLLQGRLPSVAEQRRQGDRLAVQHVSWSRDCRRRRS